MKSIIIIQNSQLSFGLDISKIYNPSRYNLFLIVNNFGLEKLKEREQKHFFPKIYLTEDFSLENIQRFIEDISGKTKGPIDIVTNAEESISLCGKLRVNFGLERQDFERFVDKSEMKRILMGSNLRVPKYILYNKSDYDKNPIMYLNHIIQKIGFPMFIKPINQLSCIAVSKIYNYDALAEWASSAVSNLYQYEIDEFIDGKLFHCDSYIKDSKILFTQVSECSRPCFDFMIGKTKGSIALPRHCKDFEILSEYTESIFKALGIPKNGVTHLEVFKTSNENLIFLEIGYRSPGILIPAMYNKYLGIDTIESHILLQVDESYKINIQYGPNAAWVAFPKREGIVKSFNEPQIKSNSQISWYVKEGEALHQPVVGRDYVGTVLLWDDNYAQLRADFEYLNEFVPFNVSPA